MIKNTVRFFLRALCDIDGYLTWATSKLFRPQYKITGQCKKRGVCCRNIAVMVSPSLWRFPWIRRWLRRWYGFVYRFELVAENETHHVLIFSCRYLKANQCSIYRFRPVICRRYPQPRYFGQPTFLPGCGYISQKE